MNITIIMNAIINIILNVVGLGLVFLLIILAIKASASEDPSIPFRRAKNAMIFYVAARLMWEIKRIVQYYYS